MSQENKGITILDPAALAQAFNTWMLRYTENPEAFGVEFQTITKFLQESAAGEEPSYGEGQAAYLLSLLDEQTADDAVEDSEAVIEGCGCKFCSARQTVRIDDTPGFMEKIDALGRTGWEDISTEQWREYIYPDGSSAIVDEPLLLHISESVENRVIDAAGLCHYIMPGWNRLVFKVVPGAPFFSL